MKCSQGRSVFRATWNSHRRLRGRSDAAFRGYPLRTEAERRKPLPSAECLCEVRPGPTRIQRLSDLAESRRKGQGQKGLCSGVWHGGGVPRVGDPTLAQAETGPEDDLVSLRRRSAAGRDAVVGIIWSFMPPPDERGETAACVAGLCVETSTERRVARNPNRVQASMGMKESSSLLQGTWMVRDAG